VNVRGGDRSMTDRDTQLMQVADNIADGTLPIGGRLPVFVHFQISRFGTNCAERRCEL
jgi:hypothetical protein